MSNVVFSSYSLHIQKEHKKWPQTCAIFSSIRQQARAKIRAEEGAIFRISASLDMNTLAYSAFCRACKVV